MTHTILPPISEAIQIGGIYEHYKGSRYKALGIARHSESLEELVVYQPLHDESQIWVRPLAMFLENVNINGEIRPRFALYEGTA